MHGTHVDYGAAFPRCVHMLDGRLRGQESTIEMDSHHLLPVGKRVVLDPVDDLNTGVRNQDVDTTESAYRIGNARIDRFFVRHVHGESKRAATVADEEAVNAGIADTV